MSSADRRSPDIRSSWFSDVENEHNQIGGRARAERSAVGRRPLVRLCVVTTWTRKIGVLATVGTSVAALAAGSGAASSPSVALSTTLTPATSAGSLSLAFAGDALWHSPLWRQAERNFSTLHAASGPSTTGFDFTPMLAELTPVVGSADLGVCHLETPIAPDGEAYSTMPLYGVPAEVADAIAAAGFDRCSTASNHTYDRGSPGIDRTVNVLESRGLGQSGMARTPDEIEPHVFDVDGVTISHLSYTFSFNGLHLPADERWRSALIEPEQIMADAHTARSLGADLVIVSLHWGVEGQSAPTGWQRDVAAQITAPGDIDLVVGHHAHVLQPIEQVNGVWVMFGLGNIISNLPTSARWPAASQDGAVVTVGVTVGADGTASFTAPVVHPTWVDKESGWIVRMVQPTLADPTIGDGLRGRLEASLSRTAAVVGAFVPS
jgi:Bacterial capsule synthesis protein PGA_cap